MADILLFPQTGTQGASGSQGAQGATGTTGPAPAVAGAGYAYVSTGVNAWAADQTPNWTGLHTFGDGAVVSTATAGKSVLVLQTTDDDATNPILELQDSAGATLLQLTGDYDLTLMAQIFS